MSTLLSISILILFCAVIAVVVIFRVAKKQSSPDKPSFARVTPSIDEGVFFYGLDHLSVQRPQIAEVLGALKKQIAAMDGFLHALLISMLAGGHVLVEGAPGLAKTKTIRLLASLIGLETKRVQCTPDMLPADLLGTDIFNPATRQFETVVGPLFTNILLADEINRATPKLQSALLEAMQEKQVSISGTSHPLPQPFFVLATQNSLEHEGTYPLPQAELDRFLMKLQVEQPTLEAEKQILALSHITDTAHSVLSGSALLQMQSEVRQVHVAQDIRDYIAELVVATRKNTLISSGASPRGSLGLLTAAQALAYICGREMVTKSDVQKLVLPVLRHRISLSTKAQLEGMSDVRVLYESVSKV